VYPYSFELITLELWSVWLPRNEGKLSWFAFPSIMVQSLNSTKCFFRFNLDYDCNFETMIFLVIFLRFSWQPNREISKIKYFTENLWKLIIIYGLRALLFRLSYNVLFA
jgi:hypothetical protein